MMFFSGKWRQSDLLGMAMDGWGSALEQWAVFGRRAESEPSKAFVFFSSHIAQGQNEGDHCIVFLGMLIGQDKGMHSRTSRMLMDPGRQNPIYRVSV